MRQVALGIDVQEASARSQNAHERQRHGNGDAASHRSRSFARAHWFPPTRIAGGRQVQSRPRSREVVLILPDVRHFVGERQNVVFELGLLLPKLGRFRVAILLKRQDQMERPSDVQGLIYLPGSSPHVSTRLGGRVRQTSIS